MVKRYGTHTIRPNAWYVIYMDYEKLEKENEQLKEVNQKLLKEIDELKSSFIKSFINKNL